VELSGDNLTIKTAPVIHRNRIARYQAVNNPDHLPFSASSIVVLRNSCLGLRFSCPFLIISYHFLSFSITDGCHLSVSFSPNR
jgi:hypothetical protein